MVFSQYEGQLLLWIQEFLRKPWLNPLVASYTKLGDSGWIWIVACLCMLVSKKTRRAGLAGIYGLLLSFLCTNLLLKHIFARTRPWLLLEGLLPLVVEGDPNSFPSGHSSAALACAVAWWRYLPAFWRGVAVICAVLMALSRLYVGVHFPSDVICGILVGSFCGWCGQKVEEKRYRSRLKLAK